MEIQKLGFTQANELVSSVEPRTDVDRDMCFSFAEIIYQAETSDAKHPIDFEEAVRFVGYSTKANAKRTLSRLKSGEVKIEKINKVRVFHIHQI
jgi:hypothetical protein